MFKLEFDIRIPNWSIQHQQMETNNQFWTTFISSTINLLSTYLSKYCTSEFPKNSVDNNTWALTPTQITAVHSRQTRISKVSYAYFCTQFLSNNSVIIKYDQSHFMPYMDYCFPQRVSLIVPISSFFSTRDFNRHKLEKMTAVGATLTKSRSLKKWRPFDCASGPRLTVIVTIWCLS